MVVEAPPLDVKEQVLVGLSQRPGFTGEPRHALSNGQVDSFNEGSLDVVGEAIIEERVLERAAFTPDQAGKGKDEGTADFVLNKLPIEEAFIRLPTVYTNARGSEPGAEMSSDGIKVGAQPISGEGRHAVEMKALLVCR